MRILVTGAGGYIGSVLVPELLAAGHDVIALDRFFFGRQRLEAAVRRLNGGARGAFTPVRADVRAIEPDHLADVDAIIDMAALSNDPAGELDPQLTQAINFEARARLARLAKKAGVQRYLLMSSCSVYGDTGETIADETTAPKPLTTYARCNQLAEEAILPLAGDGFVPIAFRNATLFGVSPRMRFDLAVNLMTLHAVRDGRIIVMGGGRQWRPFVHVRDVARAALLAIEAPAEQVAGEVFNIAHSNVQIRALAYLVRENLPFMVEITMAPDDPDRRNYRVDAGKAARHLGFMAARDPAEGVREIYEALKRGEVDEEPQAYTVRWYQALMDAERLVREVALDGRIL
ncbi:MAG: NAD-dependent epimerase/dehydratase family protein [Alphaproteobacteria bacterium]|nr:MAG: NAD-dependent epimerase/dehydratase family protein [Alphaproteobacteria bacterium]